MPSRNDPRMRGASTFGVLVLVVAACGTSPASPAKGRGRAVRTAEPIALIEADTEMACQRTSSAGGWTQLVYQSTAWRELALRADRGEADAWEELAELIEHNRKHVADTACSEDILANVRASASRLTPAD
jgi:hypothetical protein